MIVPEPGQVSNPIKGRSALTILIDLIEDPENNGNYRLSVAGDDLAKLWRAIEHDDTILSQWRGPATPTPVSGRSIKTDLVKLARILRDSDLDDAESWADTCMAAADELE